MIGTNDQYTCQSNRAFPSLPPPPPRPAVKGWQVLISLSNEHLGQHDVADVHLACSLGLPGLERYNPLDCLRWLDRAAGLVRLGTHRASNDFCRNPANYDRSWAYFRILVMVTVLQRNLGLRYNPDKIPGDAPFTPEDSFFQGAILGPGGTCATMPVVCAAVGRRLGYPIRLVSAKRHLFARWDGHGERFNIEASGRGLSSYPDDYYRTGRYATTPGEERNGCLLQSQTPRQEFAGFLAQRGHCRLALGQHREAAKCFAWASALHPENKFHAGSLIAVSDGWRRKLLPVMPRVSPRLTIAYPPRQFPHMPLAIERRLIAYDVLHGLLHDAELQDLFASATMGDQPAHLPGSLFFEYPAQALWGI